MHHVIRDQKFILIGLACGIAAWLIDSAVDSLFFSHEPFVEQLFNPSVFEIYIRSLLLLLFLSFGIYAQRTTNKLNRTNSKLLKLSSAINQTDEAICITDNRGIIEFINPAFSRVSGFSEAEAIGSRANIQKSGQHEDAFYQQMAATIESGHTFHGRVINKRKDGSCYPAMMTISPVFNSDHQITHFIGVQQSLESFEKLQQQFFQAQKMEAIGTLVGGIAHDFNNTLAAITGNLFLIKDDISDRPEIVEQIDSLEQLSFSAAEMIQQLLTFSRRGTMNMQPITLNRYIKEIAKLHKSSIPERITFTTEISDEMLNIYGDINQLHQVILNLINNARDALSESSDPVISLKLFKVESSESFRQQHPDADAQAYACLSVSDNGCGIGAELQERIFEPFFTTKEMGKGTGLGLPMVLGAVQSHHGFISIRHDGGTTFEIYLPLTDQQGIAVKLGKDSTLIKGKGETILLVDDNPGLLSTGRDILKKLNYNVITASDGDMAIERYKSQSDTIALVIIDAVMPKLGGSDALFAIRKINPDVKALFISGYHRDERNEGPVNSDQQVDLTKPFEIGTLSHLIYEKIRQS